MIDPRVSDRMAGCTDVRLTWARAQAGLDLAEYNAKCGGRFSWGRLRPAQVKDAGNHP